MKRSFFKLPENMSTQARNAFQISTVAAVAHFVAVLYYLYLMYLSQTTAITQFLTLTAITLALCVLFGIGAVLSWRGQPIRGIILVLGVLAASYPPIATLVAGLGSVLGITLIFFGPLSAFRVLPRRSGWVMTTLTILSGLATLLLDIFGSAKRPSLPGTGIQYIAVLAVVIIVFFIIRQLWTSKRLRNRIIVLMVVVLAPVLIVYSYISVRAQQQDLEQALLDRAKASAITGAAAIGASLEDAIASGQLTTEDVFDQNYVKFFEFDPTKYPQLKDDPRIYDKYHTTYDAYTDAHWQALLDSYLTDQDIVAATASDINGYLPTHNTKFSTGDGNPATDRTKRIFKDVVSTKAVRNTEPTLQQIYLQSGTGATLWDVSAPIYVNGRHWGAFRFGIQPAQTQVRIQAATSRAVVSSSIFLAILVIFAWVFGNVITNPIERLTKASQEAASGNLEVRIDIPGQGEITTLADSFNSMTARLRDFISTLESRVAERTRNLELAAEVGRTVSQVRALDVMLTDAAELILKQFDLYYVQVYLTDPSQTNLILQSGTGSVGEQLISRRHQLPLNTSSINGRAAVEKKSVVISDTTTSATFKPNPLLPDTRSEMAVPLMIGERVVGVLNMQSERPGSLSQEILPAFEALAGQLAIAIQNATFLAEANQARAEVEAQARRLTRANWEEYLDGIHKPEETGFVFEQNKVTPLTQAQEMQTAENSSALVAPISVTGESLGNLIVEMEGESPIARTEELINTVARQVAQQIENLRLLDSAERFRYEAEQASRRLTHEGWQEYTEANADKSLGYLYDLKEVRAYNQDKDSQAEESALNLPLKVRDETIGRLVVQGIESNDEESVSLANAVAERLGAHIEGLRLSMQTEQALSTTKKQAQREQALRQITSAVRGSTDPTVILRTAVRELGSLLGRKTIVRLTDTEESSKTHRPADLAGESVATNGNGSDSPAESSKADGGNE